MDYYLLKLLGIKGEYIGTNKSYNVKNSKYSLAFDIVFPKKETYWVFNESEVIRKLEPEEVVLHKFLGHF